MKANCVLSTLGGIGLANLIACGVQDSGGHAHGSECVGDYNVVWNNQIDYQLDHSDTRTCPSSVILYGPVTSGGIIYDNTTTPGQEGNSDWIYIQASTERVYSEPWCNDPIGAPMNAKFGFGQPRPGSEVNQEWMAEGYVTWTAQPSPDYVCFDATFINTAATARAILTLYYDGEDPEIRVPPKRSRRPQQRP